MNHHCTWLFPGTRAGQHISEQSLMPRLRTFGIDIQAAETQHYTISPKRSTPPP
jgi:hypothetical protein